MGRRAKLDRPVHVHLKLPAPLVGEVSLLLWSDVHGRVPLGKLSEFFEQAIREKLARVKAVMGQQTTAILGDLQQTEEVNGS